MSDAFRRLTELANRSSVIIYTMDTRGVVNALMEDANDNFDNINQKGTINSIERVGLNRSTELYESQQGLRELARGNGRLCLD